MLENIMSKLARKNSKDDTLAKKEIAAKLLRTSPEALAAFEAAYQKNILDAAVDTGSPFDVSAVQAKSAKTEAEFTAESEILNNRIVEELLDGTEYMEYNQGSFTAGTIFNRETEYGNRAQHSTDIILPTPVTAQEIMAMPETLRPQLSGTLMKKDIGEPAYLLLMGCYKMMINDFEKPEKRQAAYNMFRQGLDILDLDPVTYAILGTNKNAMSYWLPSLAHAVIEADKSGNSFFRIPDTRIVKIPMQLLQLSRLDYETLTPATLKIVDDFCFHAFNLDENGDYFVKTGTYSSKFDFRNAHVTSPKEVHELGEYLLFIQSQAVIMAGPLMRPSIYGMSTTNEWVVRKFIPDEENNPTIYKGLPLRTEYRVFIDLDAGYIMGITPYWRPDLMKQRFGHEPDADSPHQVHDYITYCAAEPKLMERYEVNKDRVQAEIEKLLPAMKKHGLSGQWSLDVMQSGDDFWLIDMALACISAMTDCVPRGLIKYANEISLPSISVPKEKKGD